MQYRLRKNLFIIWLVLTLFVNAFMFIANHPVSAQTTIVQAPIVMDTGLVSDGNPNTPELSIDVTVADVAALLAFDFYVHYNTSVLTAVGGEGYYPFTYKLPTVINDAEGWIHVGASFPLPEYTGFYTTDPYPVMRVDFSVDGMGASMLDLETVVLSDLIGQAIPATVIDGYFANIDPANIPHDVAVTDVQASPTRNVKPGEPVSINVTVANQAPYDETFTLTTKANSTTTNSQSVLLSALTETIVSFQWDTTGFAFGNYVVSAELSVVQDETDTTDNTRIFGDIVVVGTHDIAVTSIVAIPTSVNAGELISIDVTVANQGNFTETFQVSAKYGYDWPIPAGVPVETVIETKIIASMASDMSEDMTYSLDTSNVVFTPPYDWVSLWVEANVSRAGEPAVPYETNTGNNMLKTTDDVTVWLPPQPEHDLEVTLTAPPRLPLGDSTMLSATVTNRGLMSEKEVELQLLIDNTVVNSVTISELLADSSYQLGYFWTPTIEGTYNVTAYAVPVPGEDAIRNNFASRLVDVTIPKYVLFDLTHGCDPVSSYILWINNLEAKGYIIDTWGGGPITSGILDKYHIFVTAQAHSSYSSTELSAIWSFVNGSGGGLLVIGDDEPSIYTDLTSFAGIFWTKGGVGGYTTDITQHPVTEGVNAVDFANPLSCLDVSPPAIGLIRDSNGYIMLAASQVGFGKVVGIADEQSIDDWDIRMADNTKLANNVMDWLVSAKIPREKSTVTISISKTTVVLGESIIISGYITPTRVGASVTIQYKQPWDYWWTDLVTVPTNETSQYSYDWTPWMSTYDFSTTYQLRAIWFGDEATEGAESDVTTIVVIRPPPNITIDPTSGPVGTKVTVKGINFPPTMMGYLMFDDQLVGIITTDMNGNINATFNVPVSQAGAHTVKVWTSYYTLFKAEAPFTVIDLTPLDVEVDAGTIYFKQDTAEFYIQTILKGTPIDATSIKTTLYKPDGKTEILTPKKITIGFYKIQYVITGKGSMTGTYTLKVEANYETETVNANGTAIKTFLVKPTWERETPKIAAFSIASIGLISAMLMLWRKEKKKFLQTPSFSFITI